MALNLHDKALITAIEDGLPLVSQPYEAVGNMIGLSETAVIERLENLIATGVISRFGVVVNHRRVGYRANAMVVWDIPDDYVADAGRSLAELPFVSLSYQRPRRLPDWPYNLFCMVHGRERTAVCDQVAALARDCDVEDVPRDILFSRRRFKQRGAIYHRPDDRAEGRR